MAPKAGYKGAVYIGAVKIGGSTTWAYTGETRKMQDIDEFTEENVVQLPLQIVGGDITITGNYLLDTDEGQKLLKIRFDGATPITDLKLYTDKVLGTIYMTPKAGSHCIVTNVQNVGDDKSGVGTFTCTIHVNGTLEQQGSTTAVSLETIGIHALSATSANFVGRVLSAGGFGDITCYMEWGTDTSYGTDNSGAADVLDAADIAAGGIFEGISGLLVTATLYHWRLHVTHTGGAVHVVGADQTFTTD